MSGYTYPGTAPLKSTESSKELTDNAFDDIQDGTDLMKDQGFYVKGPAAGNPPPVQKRSPAKEDVTAGINWDEVTQSAVEAGVEGAVKIGANAAMNSGKKKGNKGMDQSGFSGMKFGS